MTPELIARLARASRNPRDFTALSAADQQMTARFALTAAEMLEDIRAACGLAREQGACLNPDSLLAYINDNLTTGGHHEETSPASPA
jgi:hypothetical protein